MADQAGSLLPAFPFPRGARTGFRVMLATDPPGSHPYAASRNTVVSLHVGASARITCRRGGSRHSGTAVHGDVDIIPASTPSLWELKDSDTALGLVLSPRLMSLAAEEFDLDPARVEIRNRFQIRDAQLENIGWALKAEAESGYPCGRLYLDSLAVSIAARLVRFHSSRSLQPERLTGRLTDRRLRQVLGYIEDNLSAEMSLGDIAAVVGLSVSHFKSLFRESLGMPVHQYVIRRRVDRAKTLLAEGKLSISQIALETGFAHQSHLAHHMRRVLGVSPRALKS